MRIRSPWMFDYLGLIGATWLRGWMGTLDFRAAYYDRALDPANPHHAGPMIYIFWHEYILSPIYLRGHCNITILLSQHADAETLGRATRYLGFTCVRGSTTRGGAAAVRTLLDRCASMHLGMTPDGPRGPRRRLAHGAIYLASKLQLPLVALGFGYERPWRLKSWDRFAIPRPYTRARGVVSPALRLPPDLDRDGLEHYRLQVERLLERMTREAEAWAESGTRKVVEHPVRRQRRGGAGKWLDDAAAAPRPSLDLQPPAVRAAS